MDGEVERIFEYVGMNDAMEMKISLTPIAGERAPIWSRYRLTMALHFVHMVPWSTTFVFWVLSHMWGTTYAADGFVCSKAEYISFDVSPLRRIFAREKRR